MFLFFSVAMSKTNCYVQLIGVIRKMFIMLYLLDLACQRLGCLLALFF